MGDGLMTTVLPVRMAGIRCQQAIITGQFQGVMEATTPMGFAMQFNAAIRTILQQLDRQFEVGRVAGPGQRTTDFETGAQSVQRLPLLPVSEDAQVPRYWLR